MKDETTNHVVEEGKHHYSAEESWIEPRDPKVLERLEWFKDQKLALMMHWGPYSQLGIVESWALSDDDAEWSREGIDWVADGEEFKRQYVNLNKTFNPIRFQPQIWADLAKRAGFKYVIFTTKHHDGFCMWDTKETNYRITAKDCPFHMHKYADICKHVFHAFRERGLGIAAYYSKADWHTPYYWSSGAEFGKKTWRGPSYDPKQYPRLWEKYVQFNHNQIMELMMYYGDIDILWLDAGWVGNDQQDICLGEVVEKARSVQPGLLTADRMMGGEFENYITPEQTIPDHPIQVPWESCITMGTSFSFKYEDTYKSTTEIIHTLIEVVAKGGNLALNVAPQPDGRLPEGAIKRMEELGQWLAIYGEAIYGTRICAPYYTNDFAFTRKDDITYCFRLSKQVGLDENEVLIPYEHLAQQVTLVGYEWNLDFKQINKGLKVTIPDQLNDEKTIVEVFRIR
ncbi:alpha-L-fucosidase [Virgibacillus salexigens]|uniref:alpha-L-fucosidase n=1 Tax=Virgibacillus massiliensis TaxID=1462526 RepID=A0A024Q799_9BACI|nr:alpha-L-fucosidase [Virgibacillus massiliensis]CDQ38393.1 Alpha-L-fucosidase [Virgibacillus massiliensis]